VKDLTAYLDDLVARVPGIREVWLFGSRANGRAREASDWDLLVRGDAHTMSTLQSTDAFRSDLVDIFVTVDDDEFLQPWGVNPKRGWLEEWQWVQISPTEASYIALSPSPDGHPYRGQAVSQRACRVWPK